MTETEALREALSHMAHTEGVKAVEAVIVEALQAAADPAIVKVARQLQVCKLGPVLSLEVLAAIGRLDWDGE
jgi:hypothetical protein